MSEKKKKKPLSLQIWDLSMENLIYTSACMQWQNLSLHKICFAFFEQIDTNVSPDFQVSVHVCDHALATNFFWG